MTRIAVEGQHIAGISNAATVNCVYFWQGVVLLIARVFQTCKVIKWNRGFKLSGLRLAFLQPIFAQKISESMENEEF